MENEENVGEKDMKKAKKIYKEGQIYDIQFSSSSDAFGVSYRI